MTPLRRRDLLLGALLALLPVEALARTRRRKRRRQRQRRRRFRRVRRRIRRRVRWRSVGKRRVVVAPKAPRVGWELAVSGEGAAEDVVVVKQVRPDVLVVAGPDGEQRDLEYVQEDNDENGRDLEGSVLPEGVMDGPYMESDISEWEEYDPQE
jgi:hypothetical protein